MAHKPIGKDLVNKDRRGLLRAARSDRVNHAKGFKEGVNHIHHQQEKRGWGDQRQYNAKEAPPEMCTVNGRGLNHRPWHRLQRRKEKQEIIADAPPGRSNNHKPHGFAAIQHVVPIITKLTKIPGHNTDPRVEHKQPQDTGHGRGHSIGPDQHGAINARSFDQPVCNHSQEKRGDHRTQGDKDRKQRRCQKGRPVEFVTQQKFKVAQPDKLRRQAKRIRNKQRLPNRLRCWVKEKNH